MTQMIPQKRHILEKLFYVLIDNVVTRLTLCFNAAKKLAENYDFLWKHPTMCES